MASRKDPLGVKDNDRTGVGAFEGAGVGFDEGGGCGVPPQLGVGGRSLGRLPPGWGRRRWGRGRVDTSHPLGSGWACLGG